MLASYPAGIILAIDEQRIRQSLQHNLTELVGADETALLMHYLPPVGWADVATKRDLDALGGALRSDLRVEIAELRGELRTEIAGLRGEMGTEIGGLRGELKALGARIRLLTWLVPTMIGALAVVSRVS